MELFNYFRSSASYRVRIALALKGLDYDYRSVHLQKNEQLGEVYASVSAARLVPLLRDGEHTWTRPIRNLRCCLVMPRPVPVCVRWPWTSPARSTR